MYINLVAGTVELTINRKREVRHFTDAIVAGDSDEQIRSNFRYHELFRSRHEFAQRVRVKELEEKGCVRVVTLKVIKRLGETNY